MKIAYLIIPALFVFFAVFNRVYAIDLDTAAPWLWYLEMTVCSLLTLQILFCIGRNAKFGEEDGKPRCKHCGHVLEE